jgi:hypothetical protein
MQNGSATWYLDDEYKKKEEDDILNRLETLALDGVELPF